MKPHPWTYYSHLLKERVLHPHNIGSYKKDSNINQDMRVVKEKGEMDGNIVLFSIIIDETDGIIADAKFIAFGEPILIGGADIVCDILVRKNHNQVNGFTVGLVDQKLRDFTHIPAFPKVARKMIEFIVSVIKVATKQWKDIPIKDRSAKQPPPKPSSFEGGDPNWDLFSFEEKLDLIKEVIRNEIQPYIALDAGGIEVASFNDKEEVIIAYQGACTTCPSSTGATLDAIEHILRSRLSPSLKVKPDLSLLQY